MKNTRASETEDLSARARRETGSSDEVSAKLGLPAGRSLGEGRQRG
jgi:hypothetical protein